MLAIVLASCANHHPFARARVETSIPRTWFLVAAPITQEFPRGDLQAPVLKWAKVTTFDTGPECDLELEEAENHLQRPVQCIASDDPRMIDPAPPLNVGP